ncbi:MAG: hypothetical protein AB7F35_25445 [Acetobacteraceae bacterium]
MKRDPAMRNAQSSGAAITRRRTDTQGVSIDPAAHKAVRALSQSTGISIRDLMSEAVALLLLEHSEPVPAELRRKLRINIPGLDP